MREFFSFPELINEPAARLVASGVLLMSILSICLISLDVTFVWVILLIMTYGFLARVLSGPKVSPLALIVTKILVPKFNFDEKLVPGPPKRFAQSIGLVFSTSIFILWLTNFHSISIFLLSVLSIFAFLESVLGYCFACKVFKVLISVGIVPETVCERCAVYEY
ncbi:MAG: DUF4395 domain-containing protein [SAR202 cluster bacterium]|jgi:hypothetical protein|nr:MAG: DUF4395 domain-containing protein [SAR202 cluster bacterium]MEC7733480.1 DUF4395 domain-containing protein [Chloroflexota bacterium]KAA1304310.1 MAG: DUF4395 domain-containing protein [SAR202 cluster bacterium]MEC8987098.1 DUF4395 domain-containing protein [Chloroflexota bacterium]MED5428121.1 DUF4395 domain-containing protein [Chloroflexota bacterium]